MLWLAVAGRDARHAGAVPRRRLHHPRYRLGERISRGLHRFRHQHGGRIARPVDDRSISRARAGLRDRVAEERRSAGASTPSAAIPTSRSTPASACGRIRLALFVASRRGLAPSPASCSPRGSPTRGPTTRSASSSTSSPSRCSAVSACSAASGRLTGVFLALVLIATLRNVLGLQQIGGDAQGTVIGLLLIGSLAARAPRRSGSSRGRAPFGFARLRRLEPGQIRRMPDPVRTSAPKRRGPEETP